MKLPVPVELDGRLIWDAELREPTAGDIASARREADQGKAYQAMAEWCAGCVESLDGGRVSSRQDVRRAARALPFVSAMALAVAAKVEMDGEDGISSVEDCPYCGTRRQAVRVERDGEVEDTRDHIRDLRVRLMPEGAPASVTYELQSPVEVRRRDNDELVVEVRSVTVRYPTLADCARASSGGDDSRAQIAILAEALESVNGEPASAAWKSSVGRTAFERMKARDVNALSALLRQYGMDPKVGRTCARCGMEWDSEVNLLGFFGSALRQ
jgi:hypothetical protein